MSRQHALGMYLAVCMAALAPGCRPHNAAKPQVPTWAGAVFVSWIDPGVPTPGARIAKLRSTAMPNHDTLGVARGASTYELGTVEQLSGLARIDTAAAALRWVRFADALQHQSEIRSTPGSRYLPEDAHDRKAIAVRPRRGEETFGDLSDQDFREAHFTAATVGPGAGGYVVIRWVYVPEMHRTGNVVHIREAVRRDGAIEHNVLESRPAPKLRDGTWGRVRGIA